MPLVGIVAKRRDIQAIKKEIREKSIEIVEITKQSIENIKNIKFEEIIFLQNINLDDDEYRYMNKIISNTEYLILNGDTKNDLLNKIQFQKPIKLITFGFNSKSTITISSVKNEKIIVCLQRNIERIDKKIIESQEKEIRINSIKGEKIYNELVVFIIKELHNL